MKITNEEERAEVRMINDVQIYLFLWTQDACSQHSVSEYIGIWLNETRALLFSFSFQQYSNLN